jgi:pyridoxamine 5'-phosphate oxidase
MDDISQQIIQLRREYSSHQLDELSVLSDPLAQFKYWFDEALKVEQPDPDAMTLSTATTDGHISARIVLLRGLDHRGFLFYTNYQSRKSCELMSNPRGALTFYWFSLNRQVRVEGIVEKVTRRESEEYFQTRPRGSQLGAWASPQSDVITSREALDQKLEEMESKFKEQPIPCPPYWGGFRVKPATIEFWQGRESRLHDRILYRLSDEKWQISRLAP